MAEHCFFCGGVIGELGCERCGTERRARDERRVHAKCPRCGEARLGQFGLGQVSLQACARCKGMFVTAPDWDTLLDTFALSPLPDVVVPDDQDLAGGAGPYRSAPISSAKPVDLEATIRCPTCGDEMDRLEFAAVSRVVIDVCPAHGVWLDAGELERIIATIRPEPVRVVVPAPIPELPLPPRPVAHAYDPATMSDVIAALRASAREIERSPETPLISMQDSSSLRRAPEREPVTLRRPERKKPFTEELGYALARLIRMIISPKSQP